MVTKCPGCEKPAVSWLAKLYGRTLVCQHCGQALRRNLVYLGLITVIYLLILVQTIMNIGMTGLGMILVLVLTGFYVLLSMFVPFKEDLGST